MLFRSQLHSTVGSVGAVSGTQTFTAVPKSVCTYYIGDGTQTITTDGFVLSSSFVVSHDTQTFHDLPNTPRMHLSVYDTLYVVGIANTNGEAICAAVDFMEL